MPVNEYRTRFIELKSYSEKRGFQLLTEIPDIKNWVEYIRDTRYMGECTERCWKCYEFRLDKTFRKAAELGFDFVATTLSISPHKNSVKINEIGDILSNKYNVKFYFADFKKNNGVAKSIEISRKNSFYRQNYCGCIYSKLEKDTESLWSQKSRQFRLDNLNKQNSEDVTTELFLTDEIDLHHFHPSDTKPIVELFLDNAVKEKYKTVKIIHGKGKSVKKKRIHQILKTHPSVMAFHDDSFNWGATIITLKL